MTSSRKRAEDAAPPRAARARAGERGYTLVALLAVMAILALVLTEAAPSLQQQAQREREKEAIARGEEVAEAIYLYTRMMGHLPTSMDDLIKGVTPPGSIKTIYILRREAARDPLSSNGEWKLVRQNDRAFMEFQAALAKYCGGALPTQQFIYKGFNIPPTTITNLVDLKKEEEPPGGEDTESNGTGPFIGVVSRSRRKSVLTYYGIERHDRWIFTPAYR
ncbi:MAG: type II secretion system GspH family protein [Acidobacteria bacterium]|nr:type II secretion system GspH family protein [Acidobacteriota bacterium]